VRNSLSTLVVVLLVLVNSAVRVQGAGPNGTQVGVNPTTLPLIEQITAGTAFSFLYDGKRSQDLLPQWNQTSSRKSLGDGREVKVTTYRDEATGLQISREVTVFAELSAVECILRLRNTGTRDTLIIEKILPLDLQFVAGEAGKIVLHSAHGSMGRAEDYLPVDQEVASGAELSLTHYILEGNHEDGQLPFFNLQWQDGGLIGAVGWTGQRAVRVGVKVEEALWYRPVSRPLIRSSIPARASARRVSSFCNGRERSGSLDITSSESHCSHTMCRGWMDKSLCHL
jgi:hypothetical protein